MADSLPEYIEPMLADVGKPFDSPDFIFEYKWDGFRGIVYRDTETYRITSRNGQNFKPFYPQLDFFEKLPPGIVLDGEILALDPEGNPRFQLLLGQYKAKIPRSSINNIFVAFDILFLNFESLYRVSVIERKALLAELGKSFSDERFLISEFVDTNGIALHQASEENKMEGIIAKKKDSLYHSGRRTSDWLKIKNTQSAYCLIIGYLVNAEGGFRSLILASDVSGELKHMGQVGSGFDEAARRSILSKLGDIEIEKPLVPCDIRGKWVEPKYYCRINYTEFTDDGFFRHPVFIEWIEET